jgi:hypothetical protein
MVPIANDQRERTAIEFACAPLIKGIGEREQSATQFFFVGEHGLFAKFSFEGFGQFLHGCFYFSRWKG